MQSLLASATERLVTALGAAVYLGRRLLDQSRPAR